MILFYIRHGDPIYDPDSLTPLGQEQANAVSKRLALYGVDQIYSSTSNRAIQSAMPTSELLQIPIKQLDFCNESYVWEEFAFPDSEGNKHWAAENDLVRLSFLSEDVVQYGTLWYDHPMYQSYPFKAGMERINRETDAFLLSLGYAHDRENRIYRVMHPSKERIALFAHEGFGACFLSSLLDIPYPLFAIHFGMCHTGMTVIDFSKQGDFTIPKVLTFSNDGHLYREQVAKNCDSQTIY